MVTKEKRIKFNSSFYFLVTVCNKCSLIFSNASYISYGDKAPHKSSSYTKSKVQMLSKNNVIMNSSYL